MIKKGIRFLKRQQALINEIMWANVWHDTIRGIEWLDDLPSISPGRMAVGYNYLYVMTRILNDKRPEHVLDLGLGISSTLISWYMSYYKKTGFEHTIIEHDKQWGDYYLSRHKLSDYSNILFLKRNTKEINGNKYYAYDGLDSRLQGRKYSVISIDAPQAIDRSSYARRDILTLLPEILEPDWVILLDDAEREGEKRTILDIEKVLQRNNIEYSTGEYSGATHLFVITSKSNSFLCTL